MKLTPYKNDYGYMRVDCPFCGYDAHYKPVKGSRPLDPLRDLKRHITNQAKNEALEWMLNEGTEPRPAIPHLEYMRKHTAVKPITTHALKRQYDADMTV